MSRERETLITDLSINAVDGFFYITLKLQAEIRELLTQKPEPLSDEAILNLVVQYSSRNELARAIEQQHGIGVDNE